MAADPRKLSPEELKVAEALVQMLDACDERDPVGRMLARALDHIAVLESETRIVEVPAGEVRDVLRGAAIMEPRFDYELVADNLAEAGYLLVRRVPRDTETGS